MTSTLLSIQMIFDVNVQRSFELVEFHRMHLCLYLLVGKGGTMPVHTSSMSINCGTNGHFCSCLIHALGTECLRSIIVPISDPQLTFKVSGEAIGWVRTSQADCKTAAFCSSSVSSSRKRVSHFAVESPKFFSRSWN